MAGGIHPAEWIMPPVGFHHMAYNVVAGVSGNPKSKLVVPGSSEHKERKQEAAQREQLKIAQQDQSQRLANQPRPQTAAEEYASRQRLFDYSARRLGGKRPSQYLSESESSLGVAA